MNYGDYAYIEAFPRGMFQFFPDPNLARRAQIFEIWIRPISSTAPGNLHDRTLFATRAALFELQKLVDDVEQMVQDSPDREVETRVIGEMVMDALGHLDQVAYVRFASVYRNFREAKDFEDFVGKLSADRD